MSLSATPLLKLDGLTKRFGDVAALDDVSLSIETGEVQCLLGENGAGKSTLCNVIFGVHAPDAGQMYLEGRPFRPTRPADSLAAGVAMVHQHFSLVPTMTVVENLMLGRLAGVLKRKDFASRVRELCARYGLEVNPDRRVGEMTVGERQRVEIIKCLIRDPRLVVLDEPTAVLPPEEAEALLAMCRQVAAAGRGVILVTHKLAEIAKVADRTTVLRMGKVVESVPMEKADMRALVRAMVGRDLGALDKMVAVSLGMEGVGQAGAPPYRARQPAVARNRRHDALLVDGVSYRDPSGTLRLARVTLIVKPGEIVGIAGVEGNGQSELAAIIAGLARPTEGRIFVGGRELTGRSPAEVTAAGAGIVPEDRHAVGCIEEMTVAENLFLGALGHFTRFGLLRRRAMGAAAAALMREFDVRGTGPGAQMKSLSGGNQQKTVLARELSLDPLVFLLAAQPTRGLDVGTVDAVYSRILAAREKGAGVLLISSELDELLAASDRVIVLYRGRVVGDLPATASSREAIGSLMSGHAA